MANSIPSGITFQSLANSGMPTALKSQTRQWFERVIADGESRESKVARAKLHVQAAGENVRASGEGLLVGGLLGVLHAKRATGLDAGHVPIDACIGGAMLLGSVLLAQETVGKDMGNVAASAFTIFAFRKANDLALNISAGRKPGGGSAPLAGSINKGPFAGEGEPRPSVGAFHRAENALIAAARRL